MQNLGNLSGIVLTSNPVQWDAVFVCHDCKVRISERMTGPTQPDYSHIWQYKNV